MGSEMCIRDRFDMEAFADADEDSDEILSDIAARVHFGPQFERAANASAR